jgi:hypothetical protein
MLLELGAACTNDITLLMMAAAAWLRWAPGALLMLTAHVCQDCTGLLQRFHHLNNGCNFLFWKVMSCVLPCTASQG